MTWKTFLKATVFLGAMTTGAHSAQANVFQLQPETGWSINRIGGDQPYCTLARRYSDNIVVSLAENPNNDLTFALDFQASKLDPQKLYSITITTETGFSKDMGIKPVTEKAFIIRMQDDPEFYSRIWEAPSLNIAINDDRYIMSTKGFADGKVQMKNCLASFQDPSPVENITERVEPASITTTRLSGAAQPIKTASSQKDLISNTPKATPDMRIELEALKQENETLSKSLRQEREKYEAKVAASSDSAKMFELNEKIAALSQQNTTLKRQINAGPSEQERQALTNQLQTEVQALKTKNENLQKSISAKASNELETASMREQLQRAKEENQAMQARLKSLQTQQRTQAAATDLATRIDQLISENMQLKQTLQSQTESMAQTATNEEAQSTEADLALIKTLQEQISSLGTQNQNLTEELANAQSTGGQNNKTEQALRQQLEVLKANMEDLTSEKAMLETELSSLKIRSDETMMDGGSADAEKLALQRRYSEAQREIQRLAARMEEQRIMFQHEKESLENMLFDPAVTESEQLSYLSKLEQDIQLANQALEEQQQMYEEQIATLRQDPSAPVPKIETTRIASNTIRKPITASERAATLAMSNEIERLRDEIDRLRREAEMPKTAMVEEVIRPPEMPQVTPEPEEIIVSAPDFSNSEPLMPPAEMMEEESIASLNPAAGDIAEEEKLIVRTQTKFIGNLSSAPLGEPVPYSKELDLLQKTNPNVEVLKEDQEMVVWTSNNMDGALSRALLAQNDFETAIDKVLSTAKSSCSETAAEPLVLRKSNGGNLFAYDVVCDEKTGTFVFFSDDNQTLTTFAYEGREPQKQAMEIERDNLIDALMDRMTSS